MTLPLEDSLGRVHTYLRVSVTDRCNYRCLYCMPEEGLHWMPKAEILQFEEISRLVRIMAKMGVQKIRITGGEPTIRADITDLIQAIAETPGIRDVAMTTNAHTLARLAKPLADAGLHRVNVSLDSLDAQRFTELTRGGNLQRVLDGIHAAREAGLTPIKINAVLLEGVNEHEVYDLVDYFSPYASTTELRFIEYMPFEVRRYNTIPAERLRTLLRERWELAPIKTQTSTAGPARYVTVKETGLKVGFISPLSEHFCASCNRLRLQANGHLRTCLAHEDTPSLRELLRKGDSDVQLEESIRNMVLGKPIGHDCTITDGTLFEGVMTAVGG
jgi:cyclic pyranopterin phosphate synthase